MPARSLILVLALAPGWAAAADDLFARAAAVLEAHCLRCHDAREKKGGLSLTTRAESAAGGRRGLAVVPGKPEESLLLKMVSGEKPKMPKQAEPLSPLQVDSIRAWIAGGAGWSEGSVLKAAPAAAGVWWSLRPISKPAVPRTGSAWARNPIDAFILEKLAANGLAPAPEADRRTLIRRLTYDLHGLPPAPEAIDAFERDPAPGAHERLVDRLLDSPRYGERWGRHWLDVVHYGESHGYDKDKRRPNAWPYRDYVIRAFNEDKPYARFVEEQIAGDVLFPGDPAGIVATGFIAAGPWDFVGHVELREGTADKSIARSNDRDDMVAAAMSTFASVTAHCARCHDHKFDPITQEDYYSLQAVFAGVDRADRPFDPDAETHRRRCALLAEKKSLEAKLKAFGETVAAAKSPVIDRADARISGLEKELAQVRTTGDGERKSETLGYHSEIVPRPDAVKWVQVDLGEPQPIHLVVLFPAHVAHAGHPGPGFGFPPRFRVEASNDPDFRETKTLQPETEVPNPGDRPLLIRASGTAARYVRVTATRLWKRTDDWVFALAELVVGTGGKNAAAGAEVTALDSIEAPPGWARKNLVDGFTSLASLEGPNSSPTNGWHSEIMAKQDETKWVEVDLGRAVPIDRVVLVPARPTDFPDTPGFGFPARFRVEASEEPMTAAGPRHVLADETARDFASPGDAHFLAPGGGKSARFVRVTATRLWPRTGDFVFALGELQVVSWGKNAASGARVNALDSIEAGRWSKANLVDGYSSREHLESREDWLERLAKKLELEDELEKTRLERKALIDASLDAATRLGLEDAEHRLKRVSAEISALPPPSLVYAAASDFPRNGSFAPAVTPRPVHLLYRGDVKSPGEIISPGALSCVASLEARFALQDPADEGARRAALARWLTSPENMLAWRSIVNRVWQYHFGRGIADTPNDFGRMGSKPTHPELLDWLASWFLEDGGSIKRLHRLILTSSVYRQSSRNDEECARVDGDNRLLWRMNRARLEAEAVRDAMLAVSGKLDITMGGPSVDHFFFKDDHSPTYDYTRFDVDSPASFRRSVYRFIVRSVPDPLMDSLDCPDPSILTPRRNNTLTALQALALLNTPFAVRQAEHFAERLRGMASGPGAQLEAAFRLAIGRSPSAEESNLLAMYASKHGLENACRLILNSNEFLFID